MKCEEVQSSLLEDLTFRFDEVIQTHLRECPECQCFCDDLLELEALARGLSGQVKTPSQFGSEILSSIASQRTNRILGRKPFLACLLLVIASAVLVVLWDRQGENEMLFAPDDATLSVEMPASVSGLPGTRTETSPYVEVVVEDPVQGKLILRLPRVIEIRRTEVNEDLSVRNVSY